MNAHITYRDLHTAADFDRVFALEQHVWQMSPGDAVPSALIASVVHNGGMCIAAELGDTLVGFVFGIPARKQHQWYLWSYMAGVHPDHQRKGIGFGLKAAQRVWALRHDYDLIKWTFDPMQRPNANFNFCKLGVSADTYHVNLYGTMTDGINEGLASDRFEVTWQLDALRVIALTEDDLEDVTQIPSASVKPETTLLMQTDTGELLTKPLPTDLTHHNTVFVEIPYDLAVLKQADLGKAQAWQLQFRETIQAAFAQKYTVTDFVMQNKRCYYVLTR